VDKSSQARDLNQNRAAPAATATPAPFRTSLLTVPWKIFVADAEPRIPLRVLPAYSQPFRDEISNALLLLP